MRHVWVWYQQWVRFQNICDRFVAGQTIRVTRMWTTPTQWDKSQYKTPVASHSYKQNKKRNRICRYETK